MIGCVYAMLLNVAAAAVKRATHNVAETPVGHVAGHEAHVAKK